MRSASALRSQIEAALANRIPSALTPAAKTIREVVSTGVAAIDTVLDGGLPVGAVTEMIGAECSGSQSITYAVRDRRNFWGLRPTKWLVFSTAPD